MATNALSTIPNSPFSETIGDLLFRRLQGMLVMQKQYQSICRDKTGV
jgi:hypothetical protein